MFEPYDFLKTEAVKLLRSSVYEGAKPSDINCCPLGFELSTPLPLIVKENALFWEKKIPQSPYFKEIKSLNGHICFALSDFAYAYCVKNILNENISLPTLNSITSIEDYAYMRMYMLSLKSHDESVFSNKSVKEALWAAFALVSSASPSALKNAADKALAIGNTLTAKERFNLKENCGKIGLCTALLIYRRLNLK